MNDMLEEKKTHKLSWKTNRYWTYHLQGLNIQHLKTKDEFVIFLKHRDQIIVQSKKWDLDMLGGIGAWWWGATKG